jgi:hypothetical protein
MIKNSKKGFSLIEITFALMITGMGILVIFQVFPLALNSGKWSAGDTMAIGFSEALFSEIEYKVNNLTPEEWQNVVDEWIDCGGEKPGQKCSPVFDIRNVKVEVDGKSELLEIVIPDLYDPDTKTKPSDSVIARNELQSPANAIEYPEYDSSYDGPKEYMRYRLNYTLGKTGNFTYIKKDRTGDYILLNVFLEVSYGRSSAHNKVFSTTIYYMANKEFMEELYEN